MTKAARAQPNTPRGQQTRANIVAAARAVYAEEGLRAVDMRNVAWKAGVSVGSVYRYFESAQDLIDEVDPGMRDIESKVRQLRILYDEQHDAETSWAMTKAIFQLE